MEINIGKLLLLSVKDQLHANDIYCYASLCLTDEWWLIRWWVTSISHLSVLWETSFVGVLNKHLYYRYYIIFARRGIREIHHTFISFRKLPINNNNNNIWTLNIRWLPIGMNNGLDRNNAVLVIIYLYTYILF